MRAAPFPERVRRGRGAGPGPLGLLVALWLLVVGSFPAQAHRTSDSYLRLRFDERGMTGQWALALHDLEFEIGLDANEDNAVTWGELKARKDAVLEYARSHLGLACDGTPVAVRIDPGLKVDQLANGGYVVLELAGEAVPEPARVEVEYRAFFEGNRLHRGLLLLECGGQAQQAVFNPTEPRLRFEIAKPRPWVEFGRFLVEGVWHIWIGYDHVLFLVVLLLPSVLHRQRGAWEPVDDLRGAFVNVVKVVTAFTLAHSITLSLAALQWVRLPSRLVESTIAASIVVAALNNLRPTITGRVWGLAFAFGLVHGFGFASVLADLGLPPGSLVRALVGFNAGVELGQLAVVGVLLPAIFGLRRWRGYPAIVLRGGSAAVALLAAWWMVERLRG